MTLRSNYNRLISSFNSWYFRFMPLFYLVSTATASPCFFKTSFYFFNASIYSWYLLALLSKPSALSMAYSLTLLKLLSSYSKLPRRFIEGWSWEVFTEFDMLAVLDLGIEIDWSTTTSSSSYS
jgi:hypothetical protein